MFQNVSEGKNGLKSHVISPLCFDYLKSRRIRKEVISKFLILTLFEKSKDSSFGKDFEFLKFKNTFFPEHVSMIVCEFICSENCTPLQVMFKDSINAITYPYLFKI